MDIYPLGHASFKIKGKGATVVCDPFDPQMMGIKFPKLEGMDIVTVSHQHQDHNNLAAVPGAFVIAGPGEYEVKGVGIIGTATYHDDKNGAERGENTVYTITIDGVNVCHLGDLGHKLSQDQQDKIGTVDVLLIPVGGTYTISSKAAAEVVAQLEPKIVIPMHYGGKLNLELVGNFLAEMGAEGVEPQSKLSVTKEKLPESTTVIVLG